MDDTASGRIATVGDNVVDCYPDLGVMYPGGNTVNVAVHARRLGARAAYLGALGTDTAGRVLTAAWEPAFTDGWHGWWNLNGGLSAHGTLVTAASRQPDFLDVFTIGLDGRVWTAAWSPGQAWAGWWPMGK